VQLPLPVMASKRIARARHLGGEGAGGGAGAGAGTGAGSLASFAGAGGRGVGALLAPEDMPAISL